MILIPLLMVAVLLLAGCGASHVSTPPRNNSGPDRRQASALSRSYVALGASETYGIGAIPRTRGYAYLVAHRLGARHFRDVGIPGTTLHGGYDTELSVALAGRPVLSTVFFGTNDLRAHVSRSAFMRDLRDLVDTLKQAGSRVLIIGLPDLSLLPAAALYAPRLGPIIRRWNAGMRAVARSTRASFLNLDNFAAELAAHPGYVASDGLHPSNAGHRRLAQIVAAAVRHDRLWP